MDCCLTTQDEYREYVRECAESILNILSEENVKPFTQEYLDRVDHLTTNMTRGSSYPDFDHTRIMGKTMSLAFKKYNPLPPLQ